MARKHYRYDFVCIIGIDGSGKTAHARALCAKLLLRGVDCVHISPRSSLLQYFPSMLRGWIDKHSHLSPRNLTVSDPDLDRHEARRWNGEHKAMLRIPFSLFFTIYATATYLVTIRPYLERRVVVSDRYFYDLFYNFWGDKGTIFGAVLPQPTVGILLDLPVPLAMMRMHSVADRTLPQRYYESLRRYYVGLARSHHYIIVDTSTNFEESSKSILEYVISSIKRCDNLA